MYCIECGAKIPDSSKFCPHCGQKQIESEPAIKKKMPEVAVEKEITRQVIESQEFSIDKEFLKRVMGWYLAWVLLHLGMLLIAARSLFPDGSRNSDFFPFSARSLPNDYDIREFLVYTIFPFAILVIWSMVKTQEKDDNKKDSDTDNQQREQN